MKQPLGESFRFFAEHQISAVGIFHIRMDMLCFGGKIEERTLVASKEIVQILIVSNVQQMPVIQTGSFQLFVVDFEAHGLHDVQTGACGGAGAADVTGVLRNLRFHQHNIQCGHSACPFLRFFSLYHRKSPWQDIF